MEKNNRQKKILEISKQAIYCLEKIRRKKIFQRIFLRVTREMDYNKTLFDLLCEEIILSDILKIVGIKIKGNWQASKMKRRVTCKWEFEETIFNQADDCIDFIHSILVK